MVTTKKPLKILYNESRLGINQKNDAPQFGVARFAQNFRDFFLSHKEFSIQGIVFTYQEGLHTPFSKTTTIKEQLFTEIYYDPIMVRSIYKKEWTRTTLLQYLAPIIDTVEKHLIAERPDVLFLNGFSLMNWILLYAAHKQGIPVTIQYAGIWKKEIRMAKESFSSSIRKIFYQMERDTILWCDRHIFLNEHTRRTFIQLYGAKNIVMNSSVIIPLPIVAPVSSATKDFPALKDSHSLNLGMVGRWDSIKNHRAVFRFVSATTKPPNWKVHTVTEFPKVLSEFAKQYSSKVEIHTPMQTQALADFYRSMDITILPSHFETYGGVVAESLLVGTPVVISSQVGLIDEFIKHGLLDHIISPKISGKALVKVLENIVSHNKENVKKYRSLVQYIRREHSPDKVFKQYATLFISVTK